MIKYKFEGKVSYRYEMAILLTTKNLLCTILFFGYLYLQLSILYAWAVILIGTALFIHKWLRSKNTKVVLIVAENTTVVLEESLFFGLVKIKNHHMYPIEDQHELECFLQDVQYLATNEFQIDSINKITNCTISFKNKNLLHEWEAASM